MLLRRMRLRGFRNLGTQDLDFPPEGVAIVGPNAQGKSNLLEAIYYLETLRSFRGARDDQLVAFGEGVFRIEGHLHDEEESERDLVVAAAYQRRDRRKKVTVEGIEPERLSDALGRLAAVLFSPADVELVGGPPAERRRYLDIVLSLNVPGYLRALQRYRHALAQRNAALKERSGSALVRAWDRILVEAGAVVMTERMRWVDRWAPAFSDYHAAISGGPHALLSYEPSVSGWKLDRTPGGIGAAEALMEALDEGWERDLRVGSTGSGPHRDELVVRVFEGEEDPGSDEGLPVREYGSGGQRRTAALALRLIEAATVREARDQEPIVLLDDAFAELDAARGERILDLIEREETGQVILTAPKESDVRIRRDFLPRWRIRGGMIEG